MTWKSIIGLGSIVAGIFASFPADSAARIVVPSNAVFAENYFLTVLTDTPETLWSLVQYYPDLGGAATLFNNDVNSAIFQGSYEVDPFPIAGTRVANVLYDYAAGQVTGIEYHLNLKNNS